MLISIVVAVVFAIILIFMYVGKKKSVSHSASAPMNARGEKDKVEKNKGVIEKNSLKIMSYDEALEASKQFIYNITRAVIQKFTPDTQKEVKSLGQKLYDEGVSYLHVVDIFSLSVEKNKVINKAPVEKNKSVGRQ